MSKYTFIRLTAEKGCDLLVPVRDLKWMSEIKADDLDSVQRRHFQNGARTRCELPAGEIGYFQEDLQTIHALIRNEA